MPTTINRHTYRQMIDEDLEWLRKQPYSLERMHIEAIIRWSIRVLYDGEIADAFAYREKK